MTNDGKAKIDVAAFKAGLIDRYVKFADKNDCTPVVKHRTYSSDYPQKTFDKKEEIEKLVSTPEYKAERDKFFETYNSRASERGMYCETGRVDTRPFHYVAEQFPPCSGNVSGLFKDNEWATSTLDAKVGTEATNEVTQCIQDRIAKGAKIHHIAVIASASALNNTGAAAKKFCKKGFLGLSQARAETARDKILPGLFSQAGQSSYDQSKVILNYNGGNGDGTSGPCPYRIGADGKEVLKDEFKTPEGKKELDNSKYVTVQVTFDSYQKAVNNNKEHYSGKHYCRQIYFECAPIQASAPSAKQ
jgi:hypothetical protein